MWALVLAGGASRRMGRPKADLPFDGSTLLERVVRVATGVAEQVVVVGDDAAAARLGVRAASDHVAGAGPLSGLAGGLALCPDGVHALLACDLPFVSGALLRRLRELAEDVDAVVPVIDGRRHPLCALYGRGCLPAAVACLEAGRRRMDDLLERIRVRTAGPEEIDPALLARGVINVNTPEEYRRALSEIDGGNDG